MDESFRSGRFLVNGEERHVTYPAHHTLLEVLREELGLPGTKHGCELGECGTCTVLVNDEPALSCLLLAREAEAVAISTVEGLAHGDALDPLQRAFADLGAAQCGYCTPGILMAARWLLDRNPSPTNAEIEETLAGNLCRCTGYLKITQAVQWAAESIRSGSDLPARPEWIYGSQVTETHDV